MALHSDLSSEQVFFHQTNFKRCENPFDKRLEIL